MSESPRSSISVVLIADSAAASTLNLSENFTLPAGAVWIRLGSDTPVLDALDAFLKEGDQRSKTQLIYIELQVASKLQHLINDLMDYELEELVDFELRTVVSVLHAPTLVSSLLRDAPPNPVSANSAGGSSDRTFDSASGLSLVDSLGVSLGDSLAESSGDSSDDSLDDSADAASSGEASSETSMGEVSDDLLMDGGAPSARLPELLIERVEFSEFLVLRESNHLDGLQMAQLESLLRRLNPSARMVTLDSTEKVQASEFMTPTLYDVERVELAAGWLCEIAGEFTERGEENGVDSFSFRSHRPFHPERLAELLEQFDLPGMVRGSGRIWIATRHSEMGILSLTTGTAWMVYGGVWFAAMPASGWPSDSDAREAIMESWVLPFGDRCQELAFIGVNMNIKSIRKQLNRCLLSDEEMRDGPDSWRNFSDPLPEWYGADEDGASESASDGSGQLS